MLDCIVRCWILFGCIVLGCITLCRIVLYPVGLGLIVLCSVEFYLIALCSVALIEFNAALQYATLMCKALLNLDLDLDSKCI